jgi:hypothetical protein
MYAVEEIKSSVFYPIDLFRFVFVVLYCIVLFFSVVWVSKLLQISNFENFEKICFVTKEEKKGNEREKSF